MSLYRRLAPLTEAAVAAAQKTRPLRKGRPAKAYEQFGYGTAERAYYFAPVRRSPTAKGTSGIPNHRLGTRWNP
jgi:hypothetical protein